MRIIIVLCSVFAACENRPATYDDGYNEGCALGTHYGREHGLQAGAACGEPTEVAPWEAYLLDDDTYLAGRDDGYDDCYIPAYDCAYAEVAPVWNSTCEYTPDTDWNGAACQETWPAVTDR